MSNQKRKEN